jgi:hypothetical protein
MIQHPGLTVFLGIIILIALSEITLLILNVVETIKKR